MALWIKYLVVPVLRLFITKEAGFNNIPKKGPAILAINHSSYIDGVLVLFLTAWHTNRFVYAIVAREVYEKNIFMKALLGLFRQIPTGGAVKKAVEKLENGKIVSIYPEGGRTYTGKMQKAEHTGLGVLALKTEAPVIPIGIRGTFKFWSRHRTFPTFKRCIEIRAGRPMKFKGKITKKRCLELQTKVMKKIAGLAGKEYK